MIGCIVIWSAYSAGLKAHATSKPSHICCCLRAVVHNGHIKRITDEEIQSSVLEIMSSNVSTTFITCPADPQKTLGIKLPFLVMIVKVSRTTSRPPHMPTLIAHRPCMLTCSLSSRTLSSCSQLLQPVTVLDCRSCAGDYLQNMKKYFSFEVQVLDDKNVRRRFRASNYQVPKLL